MEKFENLGNRIKEIRKKRHISQEKLAEMVSMNLRSINRIENQHNIPTLETLAKIAEVLEVEISEFFEPNNKLTRREIIDKINSMMEQMEDKELQTFYKALNNFYY